MKNQKDLNEKINLKQSEEHEIDSKSILSEDLLQRNNLNMNSLKDVLMKFNIIAENLNLDKNIKKQEAKIDEIKFDLDHKIYKSSKESEFFKEQDEIKKKFIQNLYKIRSLFVDNVKQIKDKNGILESSINNKTQIYKKIREKIANKYDTIESLNNTAVKLKQLQNEYKSKNQKIKILNR